MSTFSVSMTIESSEIMALFVLHNLILQTHMRSHPMGLDIWFFVGPFAYFHTSCERTAKALVRQRGCAGLPEPSLVAYVISTIISWAGSYLFVLMHVTWLLCCIMVKEQAFWHKHNWACWLVVLVGFVFPSIKHCISDDNAVSSMFLT